ncbi:MAG TPA: hypothetical protein VMN37_07985, partial [Gemmatimonadales bacterium]|nr:hypothetical protein [Gemmatimonadales bacterium]
AAAPPGAVAPPPAPPAPAPAPPAPAPSTSGAPPSAGQAAPRTRPEPPAPGPTGVPVEVEALREAWPEIVAEVRGGSRFLGEALAAATPGAIELPWLTVTLTEPNPLFAERLQAQAGIVEEVLRRATGTMLRLRVTEAVPPDGEAVRPRLLSEESLKADRLRAFRSKDATLDMAADALDLEIVD